MREAFTNAKPAQHAQSVAHSRVGAVDGRVPDRIVRHRSVHLGQAPMAELVDALDSKSGLSTNPQKNKTDRFPFSISGLWSAWPDGSHVSNMPRCRIGAKRERKVGGNRRRPVV